MNVSIEVDPKKELSNEKEKVERWVWFYSSVRVSIFCRFSVSGSQGQQGKFSQPRRSPLSARYLDVSKLPKWHLLSSVSYPEASSQLNMPETPHQKVSIRHPTESPQLAPFNGELPVKWLSSLILLLKVSPDIHLKKIISGACVHSLILSVSTHTSWL